MHELLLNKLAWKKKKVINNIKFIIIRLRKKIEKIVYKKG
jgi:hypothetical protein